MLTLKEVRLEIKCTIVSMQEHITKYEQENLTSKF